MIRRVLRILQEDAMILFLIYFASFFLIHFFNLKDEIGFKIFNDISNNLYLSLGYGALATFLFIKLLEFKWIRVVISFYKTKRYDIVFSIFIGILPFIISYFGEFTWWIGVILFLGYILFVLAVVFLTPNLNNLKNTKKKGIFTSDSPIVTKDKDELGISNKVESFAKSVYNNGNPESIIYGLIAPWGYGKTSFLNIFEKEEIIDKNCEVYRFNAWYFSDEKDLLNKFLNGISITLGVNTHVSYLNRSFLALVRLVDSKVGGIFGMNINIFEDKKIEDIKQDINNALKSIDKKLIIIIDDLDRVSSEKLKTVFRILDLCRGFYNTSYIICYDPANFNNIESNLKIGKTTNLHNDVFNVNSRAYQENEKNSKSISSENIDNNNLAKYIAKIVNIQYQIFPSHDKLKLYFKKLFIQDIGLTFSVNSKEGIEKGIEELFGVDKFRIWGEYISDIRSIKRIANSLIILNDVVNKEKDFIYNLFDTSQGLSFSKFFKFYILLVNHNNLYLDIFNEVRLEGYDEWGLLENGKKCKYKLEYNYGSSNREYSHNIVYKEYLDTLTEKDHSLVNDIIPYQKAKNGGHGMTSDNIDLKYISYGKNLNLYLDVLETNEKAGFNRFIIDQLQKFRESEDNISSIMQSIHSQYGSNGIRDFLLKFKEDIQSWSDSQKKSFSLIDYILANFQRYSLNGVNSWLSSDIVQILDTSIGYDNNRGANVKYIGEYFYGEGEYSSKDSVIERFFTDDWGSIGPYILMRIMRGFHSDSRYSAFRMGMTDSKEENKPDEFYRARFLRETFKYFKEKYILGEKNIFKDILELDDSYFSDKEGDFMIFSLISRYDVIKDMLFYLGKHMGYYDVSEDIHSYKNQDGEIRREIEDYYFNTCFHGEENLSILLKILATFVRPGMSDMIYDKVNLLDVISEERLILFIRENRDSISFFIENNLDNEAYYNHNSGGTEIRVSYGVFWDLFKGKFDI